MNSESIFGNVSLVSIFDLLVPYVRGNLVEIEENKEVERFRSDVADTVLLQLGITEITKDTLTDSFKEEVLERIRNMKVTPVERKKSILELLSLLSRLNNEPTSVSTTQASSYETHPDNSVVMRMVQQFLTRNQ